MKIPSFSSLTFTIFFIFSCAWASCADGRHDFLECLSKKLMNSSIFDIVYTPRNSSYASYLRSSSPNLRFTSESTPKPLAIITPEQESQIPPLIYCAKVNHKEIRIRSGGHDFEGLSYVSKVPFVIVDLIKLSEVTVDAEKKTAWIEAGATIGSLYFKIAEKSPILGFPAGFGIPVGAGGHLSGGGYGPMLRKYGLAADHVIDARIVDANGIILDRKSMGEDLFWAIRGGGGASFGVIFAWKVQLVDVPERITVFTIQKTLEQNANRLIHRWQYIAPRFDKDLYLGVVVARDSIKIIANFFFTFFGGAEKLLQLMEESFPELGLIREDCTEMSWIESVLYINSFPRESLEVLLNRTQPLLRYTKIKSDYVKKPIPENGFEGIWRFYDEKEATGSVILMIPYGGRMAEISEFAIPFPHRAGNLYKIAYICNWQEAEAQNSDKYISWIRRVYSYMTPYVSKSPRAAYMNYRDLDIGLNNNEGKTSYEQASIWGKKYFDNNFDRLVQVKTIIDPGNFFKNEQSIPPTL